MVKQRQVAPVLAAIGLAVIGVLLYLVDRQTGSVYFLPHGMSLVIGHDSLFGQVGQYLPTFVHVFVFILLTSLIIVEPMKRLAAICLFWLLLDGLFEIAQITAIAQWIAGYVPAWFTGLPFLENTARYFLAGTFDVLDLVSIGVGATAAWLTIAVSHGRLNRQQVFKSGSGRQQRGYPFVFVVLLGFVSTVGSGGGGGGGGGGGELPTLSYLGSTDPMVITATNATSIVDAFLGSDDVIGDVPVSLGLTNTSTNSYTSEIMTFIPNLTQHLVDAMDHVALNSAPTTSVVPLAMTVDVRESCMDSGFIYFTGTLNDDGTGTLYLSYTDCMEDGMTINGDVIATIYAFDIDALVPTDMSVEFRIITITGPGYNASLGGQMRIAQAVFSSTQTVTANLIFKDNQSSRMQKTENLIFVTSLDWSSYPYTQTQTINGRWYDSIDGYIEVSTEEQLSYKNLSGEFEFGGFARSGHLLFLGANNAWLLVIALSDSEVKIELDLDNDGVYEVSVIVLWSELADQNTSDIGDADGDGMHNSWETVNGLDPFNEADATEDDDGDLNTNWVEYQDHTDPQDAESYIPHADLALTISSGTLSGYPYEVLPVGVNYLYKLTLTNHGPHEAFGITVDNALPVQTSYHNGIVFDESGSLVDVCHSVSYICSIATLESGASVSIEFSVIANDIGTAIYSASVSSTSPNDPVLDNNSAVKNASIVTAGPSIQDKLDAAVDGGTLLIDPGIYLAPFEGLNFNGKNIYLESTDGPESTVIFANTNQGYASATGVTMGPLGSIKGFTLTNTSGYNGHAINLTSGNGSLISDNIFVGNGFRFGVWGAAISGYGTPTIQRNIFRNNICEMDATLDSVVFLSQPLSSAQSTIVENNVFENNDCRGLVVHTVVGNSVFPTVINNTFVGNRTAILVRTIVDQSMQTYRNNILVNNGIALESEADIESNYPVWDHNLVYGNVTDYLGMTDHTGVGGNISGNPLFVDAVNGDYHLSPGSPAIDAGSEADAPLVDFDGAQRPVDGDGDLTPATDIGAFETQ